MLSYTTKRELLELAKYINESANTISVQKSAENARNREPDGRTFLSHSSKDDAYIPTVVRILENHGATVYLDKGDPGLIGKNPQEIAVTLRSRIKRSKKLVMFATENSKNSKWVPWELGLGDGFKGESNVAIFPAIEKAGDFAWSETEYLGVYDRIIWGNFTNETQLQWLVWNHETNMAVRLREWLTR